MVEGGGRRRNDHSDHGVQIAKHIVGRHAAQAIAVRPHEMVTLGIAGGSIAPIVYLPIDLDAEPRRGGVEVDHISTNRMLAAKSQSRSVASKHLPEQHLGIAHVLAQLPRRRDLGPQQPWHAPSTALRAVPLPVPGRIWGHRPLPRIARASTCCTPTMLALAATLTSSGSSLPETQMERSASMSNVPARSIAQRVMDL
jgi:hypothetical protein